MKVRLGELAPGSCFLRGRKKNMAKKLADGSIAVVGPKGRVRTSPPKGDPEVEPAPCTLRYFGVGLRRHPDEVVEIGEGRPRKIRR